MNIIDDFYFVETVSEDVSEETTNDDLSEDSTVETVNRWLDDFGWV